MWKILIAELRYNWVQILISVLLMTMPLNILISLFESGITNESEVSDVVLNKKLVMYVTTAIMFGAMFTTASERKAVFQSGQCCL